MSTCPDGEIKNEGTKEFLEMQSLVVQYELVSWLFGLFRLPPSHQGRVKAPIFKQHLIKAQGYVT